MKKNGRVQYTAFITAYSGGGPYQNYNDFKIKNNWGKDEKLGLGNDTKSFISEID